MHFPYLIRPEEEPKLAIGYYHFPPLNSQPVYSKALLIQSTSPPFTTSLTILELHMDSFETVNDLTKLIGFALYPTSL